MVHFFSQPANKGKVIKIGESVPRFSGNELTNTVFSGQAGLKVMPFFH
jgi:hypothetical protein